VETRWIWPFELLDKLGEGGMGVVYRARYVGNDRIVAVKLVPDEIAKNPTLVARFERELEVLKQLRHPHIVHCFGGVCESKQRFYAMELVDGGTLHNLLREVGKLPWETVVDYGLQMCSALQCAHEKNVVHRDVKPGNFLITKTGKLKLSDFGLAIVIASQRITSAGKTLGTFHYMAPEQIRGKPPVTNRTDLYALGCVFFEMLTGQPPFDADTAAEVLHKHLKEEPPRVRSLEPNCPLELDALVADLLQKDPEARPATAALVAERLRQINAAPSTVVNSMSLTPAISRSVIDDDVSPITSEAFIPPSARAASGWWTMLFIGSLAWIAVLQIQLWQSSLKTAKAEAATVGMLKHGHAEVQVAAVEALRQLPTLQPSTQRLLIDQLNSGDRSVMLAVIQLMAKRPELARAARGDLARLQRTGEDPVIRNSVEPALEASKQAPASSWSSVLLGWLIPLGLAALAASLLWYGFQWARSHALIPGL
jgi:serine/threonine protein kinase